ncbi:MAG: NAD(P)-binding protein [Thermodesulfobacteriota bacterium]|nr:NAD(P)-binding protein [Thermodesulfobacteriota bacterium]
METKPEQNISQSKTKASNAVSLWKQIKGWLADKTWLFITFLWIVAAVLGYLGFKEYFTASGQSQPPWNIFYATLQLFTMDSGLVVGPIGWKLEVARFLAPAIAAWTVLKALAVIFRDRLQGLRLMRMRNHAVVCGLGRKGLQLVKDFRSAGCRVVVIECDAENDGIRRCQDLGAIVLTGSAADKALLNKARVQKADYIVAVCGDDGANVETAILTCRLIDERKHTPRDIIQCFVHIVDLKLCELFKQHDIFREGIVDSKERKCEIRIFNIFRDSARLLLAERPLDRGEITYDDDPRRAHLVVTGLGQMGESVILQAAQTAHYANSTKLRITVIDKEIEARKKSFYGRYPKFDKVCDASFLEGDVEHPDIIEKIRAFAEDKIFITTVVICLDSDARSLSAALTLVSNFRDVRVPIIARMESEIGLATLLETEDTRSAWIDCVKKFGVISKVCTLGLLKNEKMDELSRANHELSVKERRKQGRPESDSAMQPWEKLSPMFRDSSRQRSDHISVKLRAIGCFASEAIACKEAVYSFSEEELELMAKMEHARWNAERWLGGWTLGPKDVEKKTSPYLVEWDELDDGTKEYDFLHVRNIPCLVEEIGQKVYRLKG